MKRSLDDILRQSRPQTHSTPSEPAPPKLPPTEKPVRKRDRQICVRYAEKEYKHLLRKVHSSGLGQGEYIRRMSLDGQVISRRIPECDDLVIEEIARIRAMLGRLGGLMMTIRNAYESQHIAYERLEDWMEASALILQQLKERVQFLEEKLNGPH